MAHLSQDNGLLTAFKNGDDIHRATAAEVFSVQPVDITTEQRRHAKAINFGLMYGMSAFGLAKQLETDRKTAQSYIDLYFSRYPAVADYMEQMKQFAHQHGFVETHFGRRLYLPEINSPNKMRQQAAERAAINAPMQGTAADLIKRAMIDVNQAIITSQLDITMTMQVHDELVFEIANTNIDPAKTLITRAMINASDLDVPMLVDVGVGDNWDEAH